MSAPKLPTHIRIASRKSDLARLQSYLVGAALTKKHPDLKIEYIFRESLGDKNLTDPLWKMPERGVFTEDFVAGLKSGEFDVVVHSWKDLPTEDRDGLEIAATLPRADVRDVILVPKKHLEGVRQSKTLRVLSSSPRREYNLRDFLFEVFPGKLENISFSAVRGNVQTRVRKLFAGEGDALIVAKAALDRLLTAEREEFQETREFLRASLADAQWMVLPIQINPPAAAQGALAIEIKADRADLRNLFASINHIPTFTAVQKERTWLRSFGGGCHQKIGVHVGQLRDRTTLFLRGLTTAGEILNRQELSPLSFAEKTLGLKGLAVRVTESSPLTEFLNQIHSKSAIYVAKATALPTAKDSELQLSRDGNGPLVWTAGLATWKELARRGLWVHGSDEGLGEKQPDVLAFSPEATWIKLTHSEGIESGEAMKLVATYKLHTPASTLEKLLPEIATTTHFFWRSYSQFQAVFSKFPEIEKKHHSCGPGHTFELLQKTLGATAQVEIFLSEDAWKNHFGF